jgi:ABC-type multidrug transport system fused ATPase/permease subunit
MKIVIKILQILRKKDKIKLLFLFFLMSLSVIFEMLGLGILLPAFALFSSENFEIKYPLLRTILNLLGNPSKLELIKFIIIFIIIFYFIKFFFFIFLYWKQSKFISQFSQNLSAKLFQGYISMPYSEHLKRNSTTLINNINGEVGIYATGLNAFLTITSEIAIIFGIIIMLIFIEPLASFYVFIFMSTGSFLLHFFTKQRLLYLGETRQINERFISKYSSESFHGIKDIKILNKENYFFNNFKNKIIIKSNINTRSNLIIQLPRVYLELISIIGVAIIIFVMVLQGKNISIIVTFLGIFIAASFRILPSLNRIISSIQNLKLSEPVVKNLSQELINLSFYQQEYIEAGIHKFDKYINLKNISFQYENNTKKVLENISIKILKGQTIGIIGKSGSGKTTLIDLILGLYRPTSGTIFIDEIDTLNTSESLRALIGYVPQSIYLLDDSIKSNIAFGVLENDININLLNDVIENAQLKDFIESLELGIETNVGDRGVKLSGGQKQRIGIARALYNNPEILIFDEATSSLDNETESDFMNAIDVLKKQKTIIIVAHRYTTLKNCDIIYNLENGIIKNSGTYSDLNL